MALLPDPLHCLLLACRNIKIANFLSLKISLFTVIMMLYDPFLRDTEHCCFDGISHV